MKTGIPELMLAYLMTAVCLIEAAAPRPNFIFISIDDLGYADIGAYGSKLNRTPNIDRMAQEGRRLTSFYAAPVCSPSRASLMTGSYPKRALPIPHVLFPGNEVGLDPGEITVAELLKQSGYVTGMVGKWHLGDQPEFLPTRQGFDHYFGLPYSNDMGPAGDGVKSDLGQSLPKVNGKGQPPLPLMRNEIVLQRVLQEDQQALVERYTDEAVKFIQRHRAESFFLYLPHNAVHFPLYPGKRWVGRSAHGLYSDWVEEVDWSVGKVLDTLRELKLEGRTLVLFTSDNGGTERGLNTPLRGYKGSTWEGGVRVPTIAWWPGRIPAGTEHNGLSGMFDVLPTFVKLAGGQLPTDRKLDGADISTLLTGKTTVKSPHDTFYYYRGLKLEAVRHGDWKLRWTGTGASDREKQVPAAAQLYNLARDVGESTDVAASNPAVVKRLRAVADRMKDDLGLETMGPGVRKLGRVASAEPLIGFDGAVRKGFEGK
jgi:arylsulfatase A